MSEIYRDRSEGTAAKRQELLRRRREELVTMPHAVRRVVVARTARIAASMVATLFGIGLIAAAYSPNLAGRLSSVMPGIQPAPLSTLLFGAWLLGLVAWAISRARVEHRFAVAMSRYVLPSEDLDHDVERLDHEHPDDIARSMGHQLEVRSAAWAVLAAAVVLPATALWFARMLRARGWPVMSEFEASLTLHANALAVIAIGGVIAAMAMTRKALRQPHIASLALPIGVMAGGVTVLGFIKQASVAWWACGLAAIATSIGIVARWLRKERALLEVEDPAAGSELFTIRGMLRQIRESLIAIKQQLRGVKRTVWVYAGAVAMIGGAMVVGVRHKPTQALQIHPTGVAAKPLATQLIPLAPPTTAPTTYKIQRSGSRFRVEATLDDKGEILVPMIGFDTVPEGWSATMDIQLASSPTIGIMAESGMRYVTAESPEAHLEIDACSGPKPLALHLIGEHAAGLKVILYVSPRLSVASCS